MLTVNLKTGQKLIFMDFYPCKAKDLNKKLNAVLAKVSAYTKEHKKDECTR